ncbi:MAG: hypothetical protein IKJ83_03205 [Ruminococcus sp.]|nr:hypothetical protein [Ruminococcus sp.]
MDYLVWSQEYYQEAEKLKRNIERMKQKLREGSVYERRTLEDNIHKMQLILYECLQTAAYLEGIGKEKQNAA